MVSATWSIEPAEVNAMFLPPKYYRLLSPLSKLDPTDPRKVENFLIKLRAVEIAKPPSYLQSHVLTFGCTSTSSAKASGTR